MKKKIIAWFFFLGWLLLIFFFSSQNREESASLSNGFLKIMENVTHIPLTSSVMSFAIRKIAHFSEYGILGIFGMNLLRVYDKNTRKNIFFLCFFCFLYALSDEVHQIFVSGRSAQMFDVCIDSLGSFFGITFSLFFIRLKKELPTHR